MRLFLLPISTRQSLIYCQRLNQQLSAETTYIDKITTKSSKVWLDWEKKDNGWKKKVTSYGNTLFQRLPFEEWGLKSVPPLSAMRRKEEIEGKKEVQIVYPGEAIDPEKVQDTLQMYGSDAKQGFHTKWMWGSIIGMPLSAPFALIPFIPNIPFFYLCFRAWSHWRARGGSKHLRFLLDNKLVESTPSSVLRVAYAEAIMDKSLGELGMELDSIRSKTSSQPALDVNGEKLLLGETSGDLIADYLEVPELAVEINRAVWQIGRTLKAMQELKEEKKEIEAVTKTPG